MELRNAGGRVVPRMCMHGPVGPCGDIQSTFMVSWSLYGSRRSRYVSIRATFPVLAPSLNSFGPGLVNHVPPLISCAPSRVAGYRTRGSGVSACTSGPSHRPCAARSSSAHRRYQLYDAEDAAAGCRVRLKEARSCLGEGVHEELQQCGSAGGVSGEAPSPGSDFEYTEEGTIVFQMLGV